MGSNLYVAASGAMSRLRQLEVVANNLANSETVGFKADRSVFRAAVEYALLGEDGAPTPGAPGGVYARVGATGADLQPGSIRKTGDPLDVAIDGPGYFVVETDEGERYTRAGSFSIGKELELLTRAGDKVLGASGAIELSGSQVHIRGNGSITDLRGQELGRLRVVEFEDPSVLTKQGNGLFFAPQGVEPKEIEAPSLIEESVEGSNVQTVAELATMVILQRAYDASMQAMQSEDRATQRLIEEISQ